ncbi:hypothetical protein [Streptomyces chartreusis]|uniref:hypothetical protein n=1 Tax=Streptomyces chartreusis TaxID=1969 RepID=UPI0037BCBBD0
MEEKIQKSEKAVRWGLWVRFLWYIIAGVAQAMLWGILTPNHFFRHLRSILGWDIGLVIHFWVIRSKSRSPGPAMT